MTFYASVRNVKLDFVGSKYFKVDFHCHSPASDDFPRDPKQSKCTYREWLLGLMAHEIDCVVLSDHNTGAAIDSVIHELGILKAEFELGQMNGYRTLVVLPAVELTACDSTHVLAIFRENTKSVTIENFISHLAPPKNGRKNSDLVLGVGTAKIINEAKAFSEDILVIPAHIDKNKGVLSISSQSAIEDIFDAGPDAVEVIDCPSLIGEKYQRNLIASLAHVKGSDAHCIDELGRSFTWVKMTEPCFDGLSLALTEPEHCIVRHPQVPPKLSENLITKLTLKSKLCQTPSGDPIQINFSPWYTALIGSRGSGKSTLIESLRMALRRDDDERLPSEMVSSISGFRDDAYDNDSMVSVEYCKENELYRLDWSKKHATMYHRDNGEWVEESDKFTLKRFPVSIYSQKMLFEIATKYDAFLSVIDASEMVNYEGWSDNNERLIIEYKSACNEYAGAQQELNKLTGFKAEYDDVERKLKVLHGSGLNSLQEKLKALQNKLADVDAVLGSHEEQLLNVGEIIKKQEVIFGEFLVDEVDSHQNLLKSVVTSQSQMNLELTALHDKFHQAILNARLNEVYTGLIEKVNETKKELSDEIEKLETANITQEEFTTLIESEAHLSKQIQSSADRENKVEQALENKKICYEALVTHREKLTDLRMKFIESLDNQDLKVEVLPLGCEINKTVESYQSASTVDRFNQNLYDDDNNKALFYSFSSIRPYDKDVKVQRYAEVESLKQYHQDLVSGVETGHYSRTHGSLLNRLKQLSQDQVDSLMSWFPEDGLSIRFKDNEGQFKPLSTASPGQKSASMLSFLLSYGDDPLVLDQPEDDLDTGMLSSSVIPAIHANKTNRQLIIVTHSAPIVVNGDAEYVFAMKQQSRKLQPIIAGGLQDKNIKDLICNQMEGGEPAFRTRYKRIMG